MSRLAVLYHPIFLEHQPGSSHPESPRRLQSIMDLLQNKGFWNKATLMQPAAATREQIALIHDPEYIAYVESKRGLDHALLDGGDTVLSASSVDAAEFAAGAAIQAVNLVFEQEYDKVFAAVRPPGHHAERGKGMGFCIFNNIAIAAGYALHHGFAKKILIVDWDVHHGNGTQEIFYANPDVFYLSLHQFPLYPMSGTRRQTGEGAGEGFTMNAPLPAGSGDDEYAATLESALLEIERMFKPDLLLISAGFDAHVHDPLGGMRVTEEGFYKLTELTANFAQKHCNGRIISFLEGGYAYPALAQSVYRHLHCLLKH
ncbi:MAG TPA: histone deacetylase [Caldithrix abyssi]|uniref:Histone deacetylase n=1 Tax=Caldithrix abyssi TaxID=187145 RepID=A0A7V5PPD6_CALAY|nr:histone deacetylase [Caldithrix abyssi]